VTRPSKRELEHELDDIDDGETHPSGDRQYELLEDAAAFVEREVTIPKRDRLVSGPITKRQV
jgi:hypothetical protein